MHAEAAAAIFSVIASCRLHGLDPFQYLEEILRVLPYWPRDRYLELAPKYWRATRGRLRADELATPISAFDVPPPPGPVAAMFAPVHAGASPITDPRRR
jgi:transposase